MTTSGPFEPSSSSRKDDPDQRDARQQNAAYKRSNAPPRGRTSRYSHSFPMPTADRHNNINGRRSHHDDGRGQNLSSTRATSQEPLHGYRGGFRRKTPFVPTRRNPPGPPCPDPDLEQHRELSSFPSRQTMSNGSFVQGKSVPLPSATRDLPRSKNASVYRERPFHEPHPSASAHPPRRYNLIANPLDRLSTSPDPQPPEPQTEKRKIRGIPDEGDFMLTWERKPQRKNGKAQAAKKENGQETVVLIDIDDSPDGPPPKPLATGHGARQNRSVSREGRQSPNMPPHSARRSRSVSQEGRQTPNVPPLKSAPRKSRSVSQDPNDHPPKQSAKNGPGRPLIRSVPAPTPPRAKRKRREPSPDRCGVDVEANEPPQPPEMEVEASVSVGQREWERFNCDEERVIKKFLERTEKYPGLISLSSQFLTTAALFRVLLAAKPDEKLMRRVELEQNKIAVLDDEMCRVLSRYRPFSLNLSCNLMTGLPHQISFLVDLQVLNLSRNGLTSVPESICQLRNLKELALGFNKLEKLPSGFAKLTNLLQIGLRENRLTCLPDDLSAEHCVLETLDISGNDELSYLPQCAKHWTQLQDLQIDDTKLVRQLLKADHRLPAAALAQKLAGLNEKQLADRRIATKPARVSSEKDAEEVVAV